MAKVVTQCHTCIPYSRYCIHSIRRRGYYLFHRPVLCGIYSRVATNQEQRLLISVNLTLVPRPLPLFNVHGESGDGEKSDRFTDLEEDEDRLQNELLLDDC